MRQLQTLAQLWGGDTCPSSWHWEAEQVDLCEFLDSLIYRAISRTTRATL